jgi:hypothetical protein
MQVLVVELGWVPATQFALDGLLVLVILLEVTSH